MDTNHKQAEDEMAVLRWVLGTLKHAKYSEDGEDRLMTQKLLAKLDLGTFRHEWNISGAYFMTILNWLSDHGLVWFKTPHAINCVTIDIHKTNYDALVQHRNALAGYSKTVSSLSHNDLEMTPKAGGQWQVAYKGNPPQEWSNKTQSAMILSALIKSPNKSLSYHQILTLLEKPVMAAALLSKQMSNRKSNAIEYTKSPINHLKSQLKSLGIDQPRDFIGKKNQEVYLK